MAGFFAEAVMLLHFAVLAFLLVFCGLYSVDLSNRLSGRGWTVPGSEEARAERAQDVGFAERGSSSVTLLIHDDRFSAPSTQFDQRVAGVHQAVRPSTRVHGILFVPLRAKTIWNSCIDPVANAACDPAR